MWRRWWNLLANERGQLNLGSFGNTLTQFLPTLSNIGASLYGQQTATGLPRLAEQAGGAALIGAALRPQDDVVAPSAFDLRGPYGTSAVNYLQGLYQAPQNPFAAGGIAEQYLPFYNQQEQALLNDVQTKMAAGLPSGLSPAMQGSEVAGLRSALANYILPQRQAFFADLTRENMIRQQEAAGTVYGGERELSLAEYEGQINAALANARTESERNAILASLGTALLLAGRGGTGTGAGLPGQTGTGGGLMDSIGRFLSGGQAGGAVDWSRIGGQILNSGGINGPLAQQIGQLLGTTIGFDAATMGGGLSGVTAMTSHGVAIPIEAISGAEGAAASGGIGSALGTLGLTASGALLAYNAPNIGQNQFQSTAMGAAGGAMAGFAVGGPIGAAVGALIGGVQAFFRERDQQHELKDQLRRLDVDSQGAQVQEIGLWLGDKMRTAGADASGYLGFMSEQLANASAGPSQFSYQGIGGTLDQQQAVAMVGGQLLLRALQQTNPQLTSLNQVPGLRSEFIDYFTRYQFPAGYLPQSQITNFAGYAGLAQGGYLPFGGSAVVGERGPELLLAGPGSAVIPNITSGQGGMNLRGPSGASIGVNRMLNFQGPAGASLGIGPQVSNYATNPATQPGGGIRDYVQALLASRGAPDVRTQPVAPRVMLPDVSRAFEGPPAPNPASALIGQLPTYAPPNVQLLLDAIRAGSLQPRRQRRAAYGTPTYA